MAHVKKKVPSLYFSSLSLHLSLHLLFSVTPSILTLAPRLLQMALADYTNAYWKWPISISHGNSQAGLIGQGGGWNFWVDAKTACSRLQTCCSIAQIFSSGTPFWAYEYFSWGEGGVDLPLTWKVALVYF